MCFIYKHCRIHIFANKTFRQNSCLEFLLFEIKYQKSLHCILEKWITAVTAHFRNKIISPSAYFTWPNTQCGKHHLVLILKNEPKRLLHLGGPRTRDVKGKEEEKKKVYFFFCTFNHTPNVTNGLFNNAWKVCVNLLCQLKVFFFVLAETAWWSEKGF